MIKCYGKYLLLLFCPPAYCNEYRANIEMNQLPVFNSSMRVVKEIPLPPGFERVIVPANSFAGYLRNLPLRKDKTVYLYNQQPKSNQSLHYAVIDMSTGNKDLQQCADVVMRLRAEYFFSRKLYDSIRFPKGNHSVYTYSGFCKPGDRDNHAAFMGFMEKVFINCGSYQLQQQLKPVADFSAMQIGDVLVKGGAPGHAEIVVDMAVNRHTGKKIYLLLEGYMPAQDMHILLNPSSAQWGPWYEMDTKKEIITSSWIFTTAQLRRW